MELWVSLLIVNAGRGIDKFMALRTKRWIMAFIAMLLLGLCIVVSNHYKRTSVVWDERMSSALNLEIMYQGFSVYCLGGPLGDSRYSYYLPELSEVPGEMMFSASILEELDGYREQFFIPEPTTFISPSHPNADALIKESSAAPLTLVTDSSYWYLGYALPNEKTALDFLEYYKSQAETGKIALPDVIEFGTRRVSRLSKWMQWGVDPQLLPPEKFDAEKSDSYRERLTLSPILLEGEPSFIDRLTGLWFRSVDASYGSNTHLAYIPVMIERPSLRGSDAMVLYLDGHVEVARYPGQFPMTEAFIAELESLDDVKRN